MSFLDSFDPKKDAAALDTVLDHAATVLVSKVVPALKDAASDAIGTAAKDISAVIAQANTDANALLGQVLTEMGKATTLLERLIALLERLDGANVTLKLGPPA